MKWCVFQCKPMAAEVRRQRVELHAMPGGSMQQRHDLFGVGRAFVQPVAQFRAVAGAVGPQIG